MNELKVKKFEIKKNKRNPINLHKRIESYSNLYVKEHLLAIKWIGNLGSNKDNSLETVDIIDTYRLLEFALNKLYNNDEKNINKIAKQINKNKGKRK